MKTILMTFLAMTFLAMTLLAGLVSQASVASAKERGYKAMHCNPRTGACTPAARTARPTPLRSPRGYLPTRKRGSEYDYPRFGSERWWQLQEDQD